MSESGSFTFVDLFAGIGGFHAALHAMGGECVLASEIDPRARSIYELNWGVSPAGDIRDIAAPGSPILRSLPARVDVLTAGFPCQPFSKSGKQSGRKDDRGTLFDSIADIVESKQPALVLLENVRNFAGPRHIEEFRYVIERLRSAGYQVSSQPTVLSPHRIRPTFGGRPQVRERLFIAASYAPRRRKHDPGVLAILKDAQLDSVHQWNLSKVLETTSKVVSRSAISAEEEMWLIAWEEFRSRVCRKTGVPLPGFPLWADEWDPSITQRRRSHRLSQVPTWKQTFLKNNWRFFDEHSDLIVKWKSKFNVEEFPATRRKFEWQAQDAKSIWECAIHLRPSGIRVKKMTYLPALVAVNQTSVIGPQKRRISVREAARLQGLPDWFQFGPQADGESYKQLGNGVNVGVVWQALKAVAERDEEVLTKRAPHLVRAIRQSPVNPDQALRRKR